jgi:hypothetical protein
MKRIIAIVIAAAVLVPEPVVAQSNNNDYTPLNSRIKRNRQFPLDIPRYLDPAKVGKVSRERGKAMLDQFSRCIYDRSNQQALSLLERTDLGFNNFRQINMDTERATRAYGFNDCLRRVSQAFSTGSRLRFSAGGLRQWMLQEAYLAKFPEGPTWVKPGNSIDERAPLPLSQNDGTVRAIMDFVDCVVATNPHSADFFFRAESGSPDEQAAIADLSPTLGPCVPEGQQVQLMPDVLRVWIGEGLWHAANNNSPTLAGGSI